MLLRLLDVPFLGTAISGVPARTLDLILTHVCSPRWGRRRRNEKKRARCLAYLVMRHAWISLKATNDTRGAGRLDGPRGRVAASSAERLHSTTLLLHFVPKPSSEDAQLLAEGVSEQVLYICIPKSTSLRFRSRSFMSTLPSQVCSRCPMASIFEQRSCSKLDKTVLCIAETMPKPSRCIKSMSTSQGAGDCSFDPYLHAFASAYQLHVQNFAYFCKEAFQKPSKRQVALLRCKRDLLIPPLAARLSIAAAPSLSVQMPMLLIRSIGTCSTLRISYPAA